jgi:hypothetical protein
MERWLDQLVRQRAAMRCEYCHAPEFASFLPFVVDHIIARQHGGETMAVNLALACGRCNQHKGPNIAGIDRETGQLTRLYHPRNDRWSEHFRWDAAVLAGRTDVGRTTIAVLAMNSPSQLEHRFSLLAEGFVLYADG